MNAQKLSDNIAKLFERVSRSAEKSQYHNSDILIIAVSKTRSAQDIRAAHACGLSHFGENYLQEAQAKISDLRDLDLVWHFIGPIQSNKTTAIAEQFDWVQSVDREKIARRLSAQRPAHLPQLNVCLQVNISGESSKSGVAPGQVAALARTVLTLPNLKLRGLMAIPAANATADLQREAFSELRRLLAGISNLAADIDTLSMGMSDDMEVAISEGATMVRVGTAIFGPRNR
jgi:pyridoxal phosphate enzyme (YggS family)